MSDRPDGVGELRAAAERLDRIAADLADDETPDSRAVELAKEAAQIAADAGRHAADAARQLAERSSDAR